MSNISEHILHMRMAQKEINRLTAAIAKSQSELAQAREYIRQLEIGHGNKEDGDGR